MLVSNIQFPFCRVCSSELWFHNWGCLGFSFWTYLALLTPSDALCCSDSLIVATKPKPPPKHVDGNLDDDEDHELRFHIPQSITGWKRRLFIALREKLKLPDILLMAMVSLSVKTWILIVLWFILAPVAQKFDLGPLYVLATGFAIIFYNLGQRQPGDVSAYSIFNEDFRELPGTLNAERLDRDIRAGQFWEICCWRYQILYHQNICTTTVQETC